MEEKSEELSRGCRGGVTPTTVSFPHAGNLKDGGLRIPTDKTTRWGIVPTQGPSKLGEANGVQKVRYVSGINKHFAETAGASEHSESGDPRGRLIQRVKRFNTQNRWICRLYRLADALGF